MQLKNDMKDFQIGSFLPKKKRSFLTILLIDSKSTLVFKQEVGKIIVYFNGVDFRCIIL